MFNAFARVRQIFPSPTWSATLVIMIGVLSGQPFLEIANGSTSYWHDGQDAAAQDPPAPAEVKPACVYPNPNEYGEHSIAVGTLKFNEKAESISLETGPLTVATIGALPLTDIYFKLLRIKNRPVEILFQDGATRKAPGLLAEYEGKLITSNELTGVGTTTFYFGNTFSIGLSGCTAHFVYAKFSGNHTRIVIRSAVNSAGTS